MKAFALKWKKVIGIILAALVVLAVCVGVYVKKDQERKEREATLASINTLFDDFENEKNREKKLEIHRSLEKNEQWKNSRFDEVKNLYDQKMNLTKKFFLDDYKSILEKNTIEFENEKNKKVLQKCMDNLTNLKTLIQTEKVDEIKNWKEMDALITSYQERMDVIKKEEKEAEEKKKAEEEAKRKKEEEAAKKAEEEAAKKAEEEAQAAAADAQPETNDSYQQETPEYQEDNNYYDAGNDYSNDEPSYDNGGSDDSGNGYDDYIEDSNNSNNYSNDSYTPGHGWALDQDGNKVEGSDYYWDDRTGEAWNVDGETWNIYDFW